MRRSWFRHTLLALACLIPWHAYALEADVALRLIEEYSSNSGRSSVNEVEEFIHQPGITVGLAHESRTFELDASYDYLRRIFQEDDFDDESRVTGQGTLLWRILPDRLDFEAKNTRTETTRSALEARSPNNRFVSHKTELGPTLRFQPRGQDQWEFAYRYAEDSGSLADGETKRLSTRYTVVPNPRSRYYLELADIDREFDGDESPDIETQTAILGWASETANLTYEIAGGYSRSERSQNRDDVNAPIVQGNLVWQATPNTSWSLRGAREVRDRSIQLDEGTTQRGRPVQANADLNELFENTRGEIAWRYGPRINSIEIGAFYDEEDYEDSATDLEETGVWLEYSRQLTRNTQLTFYVSQSEQDFVDENDSLDRTEAVLELTRDFSPRLVGTLGATYDDREGDVRFNSYDLWSAFVSIEYFMLGTARRASSRIR